MIDEFCIAFPHLDKVDLNKSTVLYFDFTIIFTHSIISSWAFSLVLSVEKIPKKLSFNKYISWKLNLLMKKYRLRGEIALFFNQNDKKLIFWLGSTPEL